MEKRTYISPAIKTRTIKPVHLCDASRPETLSVSFDGNAKDESAESKSDVGFVGFGGE